MNVVLIQAYKALYTLFLSLFKLYTLLQWDRWSVFHFDPRSGRFMLFAMQIFKSLKQDQCFCHKVSYFQPSCHGFQKQKLLSASGENLCVLWNVIFPTFFFFSILFCLLLLFYDITLIFILAFKMLFNMKAGWIFAKVLHMNLQKKKTVFQS